MRISAGASLPPNLKPTKRTLRVGLVILAASLTGASVGHAGELVVYNLSDKTTTCSVDGYGDIAFRVEPGQRLNIPPSFKSRDPKSDNYTLNTAECGGLKMRAMNITPESSDRMLFLNGRQNRVLNVLLYASIPTDPAVGFAPLARWLALSYQAAHSEVLVNIVLDPSVEVYKFPALQDHFSANGFDVAEIDTVFLQWLKDQNLIAPAHIIGDEPLPVGKAAVTIDGEVYGVPSWLCSDFVFSTAGEIGNVKTFADLQAFLAATPAGRRNLVGDLDGSWTIPAFYIQAFVQSHADMTVAAAAAAPTDASIVARLAKFGSYCKLSSDDPCIDGTFHSAKDGSVERDFVAERAGTDLGFSERSFFLAYYQSGPVALSLAAMPWGDNPDAPRLVYSDAFVTSRTTCGKDPCEADAAGFAAFMTSVATKKYIAMAGDLPGDPWRHLLVATKPFYEDKDVKGDPVYSRLASGFLQGNIQPYLNSFTPTLQYDLLSGICLALRNESPGWTCSAKKPD
jgi:thiamine pyridinylase